MIKRYEIVANNGQVIEHGFADYFSAAYQATKYKIIGYINDTFMIREYDLGKYGSDELTILITR